MDARTQRRINREKEKERKKDKRVWDEYWEEYHKNLRALENEVYDSIIEMINKMKPSQLNLLGRKMNMYYKKQIEKQDYRYKCSQLDDRTVRRMERERKKKEREDAIYRKKHYYEIYQDDSFENIYTDKFVYDSYIKIVDYIDKLDSYSFLGIALQTQPATSWNVRMRVYKYIREMEKAIRKERHRHRRRALEWADESVRSIYNKISERSKK